MLGGRQRIELLPWDKSNEPIVTLVINVCRQYCDDIYGIIIPITRSVDHGQPHAHNNAMKHNITYRKEDKKVTKIHSPRIELGTSRM